MLYDILCTIPKGPTEYVFIEEKFEETRQGPSAGAFAPLVETLSTHGGAVEVTDYGKVAAVMLSYKDYLWLVAHANEPFEPKQQLAGSAELVGELDAASQQITDSVLGSLRKTAHEL